MEFLLNKSSNMGERGCNRPELSDVVSRQKSLAKHGAHCTELLLLLNTPGPRARQHTNGENVQFSRPGI